MKVCLVLIFANVITSYFCMGGGERRMFLCYHTFKDTSIPDHLLGDEYVSSRMLDEVKEFE